MDLITFYRDHGISFLTEGHKHCRPGWVNVPCPFCSGNPGYHLGYEIAANYYYCWRCGWHPLVETIGKLLNISNEESFRLLQPYKHLIPDHVFKDPPKKEVFKLPSNAEPLSVQSRNYLERRGFNPDQLINEWDIMSTGPISQLDGISYNHRILMPIYWEGKRVTFQTRDITNKHPMKYLACPKHREIIHHKHLIYGKPEGWRSTGICVEGITDVWKVGVRSFCTFGIEFTNQQVRLIAKTFDRIIIAFDPDPQARIQAIKLMNELEFREVETFVLFIDKDPGSMNQEEVEDSILKWL